MTTAAALEPTKAAPPANRLAGKVVLVTGATRGIGRAIAHAAAAEGARVAVCGRTKDDLIAVSEELRSLGAECCAVKIDLADYASCVKLVDGVHRAFGRIDVLVNNHGVLGPRETLMEYPAEDWSSVLDVNLNSAFWVAKEALGKMVPQKTGSVIMVSSGVGRVGRAKWGAYAVAKAGVECMVDILAEELKEQGIRVNSVNPGGVRTTMRAAAFPSEDPSTLPAPADITNVFVYLASDASRGVSGERFDARDWMGRTDF